MIQYGVLFATGFLFLYQLLVPWGWSADLVSPGPYYALLGGLVIFPFSAVATLWRPRIAAWSGLAGGVLGMVWPITALVLGLGRWSELLFCAALPTVIIAFSLYRVLRLRAIAGARVRLPAAVCGPACAASVSRLLLDVPLGRDRKSDRPGASALARQRLDVASFRGPAGRPWVGLEPEPIV